MSWQSMTSEQVAEFQELESDASPRVGGIYRSSKKIWVFVILTQIPVQVLVIKNLLTDSATGIELFEDLVLLCAGVMVIAWVAPLLWRDARFGLLDGGLARVTRKSAV